MWQKISFKLKRPYQKQILKMKKKNREIIVMTSEALVSALKHFEGCRLEAYRCPGGVWTIGYGHTRNVMKGDCYSQEWAEETLRRDIEFVEREVLRLNVCKTQAQLDALVSLAFNIGIGRLKDSTLLRCIRRGATADVITREWKRWNKAGGKVLKGLVARRQWEILRYFQESTYLPFFNNGR